MRHLRSFFHVLRTTNYVSLGKELAFFIRFFILIILFLFTDMLRQLGRLPLVSRIVAPIKQPASSFFNRVMNVFNSRADGEISSIDLVHLAVKHLRQKKTRTIITIGGMAIGFGAIIFLLSLGYGVERLVISRVARLEELKQINVTVGQAASLKLNDDTLNDFKSIEHVDAVLPLVSIVTKVTYNNSVSDAIGYAASRQYLEESATQLLRGKLYDDGEIVGYSPPEPGGQVAGASTERILGAKMYKPIGEVRYSIYPLIWKPVYAEPSFQAPIIGYTTRVVGNVQADEVWGESYDFFNPNDVPDDLLEGIDANEVVYHPWIHTDFPLWKKQPCDIESADCNDELYVIDRDSGVQRVSSGYISEDDVGITRFQTIGNEAALPQEGNTIQSVQIKLPTKRYVEVYSDNWQSSAVSFFTAANETTPSVNGQLIYGDSYPTSTGWGAAGTNNNGKQLGYWVEAKVPIWWRLTCEGCEQTYLPETTESGKQRMAYVRFRASDVELVDLSEPPNANQGAVLGIATESGTLAGDTTTANVSTSSAATTLDATATEAEIVSANGLTINPIKLDDGSIEWITIASGSAEAQAAQKRIVPFGSTSGRVAVVNAALLNVNNIPEADALGKTFTANFVLDETLFDDQTAAESEPVELTIIGVMPGSKTPAFYIPFSDAKNMGISNYTEAKVVVSGENYLKEARQSIEAKGFRTASVIDTVNKITSLFATVRLLLSLLGFVALGVAALGMFNTLTVSLLEKTREVGLMKAIGMRGNEVKRLFLAESILMGLSGGIFGLVLSFIAGNVLSVLISSLSITKGLGYIHLVHTPLLLAVIIVVIAFLIGVLTGLYPSHRATQISALNALRYE